MDSCPKNGLKYLNPWSLSATSVNNPLSDFLAGTRTKLPTQNINIYFLPNESLSQPVLHHSHPLGTPLITDWFIDLQAVFTHGGPEQSGTPPGWTAG